MKLLTIDIETVPNQLLSDGCFPKFDPEAVSYGNTKDPGKRAAKLSAEREKFDKGLSKKMSLDPAMCQLVTLGAITYDTETKTVLNDVSVQLREDDEHDDLDAVSGAWEAIHAAYRERTPIVTFNGLSFDLPVLFFRGLSLDIPIDKAMYSRLLGRYDNKFHYDLMLLLANFDRQRWHTADFYFRLFNLGGKSGFDGSDVYPAYQAGEYDKIADYNHDEVLTMCKLFARLEPWIQVNIEGAE